MRPFAIQLTFFAFVILGFLTSCKNSSGSVQQEQKSTQNEIAKKNIESKNGYKEFTWGQTVEDVKSKVNDLIRDPNFDYYFKAPQFAMIFFHSSDFNNRVPHPMKLEKGKIIYHKSKSKSLSFWFLNNKLLAVEIMVSGNIDAFSELKEKYGKIEPVTIIGKSEGEYETAAWDQDPLRLIVWERLPPNPLETVTYIDGLWFQNLRKKLLEEGSKKRAEQKNKID